MLSNPLRSVKQVVEGLPYRSTILRAAVCLAILSLSPSAEHSIEDGPYSAIVNGELGVERSLSFKSLVRVRCVGNKLKVNAGIPSAGLGVTRVIILVLDFNVWSYHIGKRNTGDTTNPCDHRTNLLEGFIRGLLFQYGCWKGVWGRMSILP
jgi:hypothetical protein